MRRCHQLDVPVVHVVCRNNGSATGPSLSCRHIHHPLTCLRVIDLEPLLVPFHDQQMMQGFKEEHLLDLLVVLAALNRT